MKLDTDTLSILDGAVGLHESIEIIYTVDEPMFTARLLTCDGMYQTAVGLGDTVVEALLDLAKEITKTRPS